MDPSALIFVALAVAWGAYLLPTAIKHRDEVQRGRSVERFSHRMRVLARRVPTSSREAQLVVTPARTPRADEAPAPTRTAAPAPTKAQVAARRRAAAVAARRRRNVLSVILLGLVTVAGLSLGGLFTPWWTAAPAGVLVAWLVACRLMVKSEIRTDARVLGTVRTNPVDDAETELMPAVDVDTQSPVVADEEDVVDDDPSRWDMVPVTLPTYVTKPAAERRTVQTIDLESTGVWTSGRTEVDAAIARAADEERKAANAAEQQPERRATGT